jgi:PncC family amidohydrolase
VKISLVICSVVYKIRKTEKRVCILLYFGEKMAKNHIFTESSHKFLMQSGKKISVAESCTGGMLGFYLTSYPGSSAFFEGGFQTYSNIAKEKLLAVKHETLDKYGAVSEEVAMEMAAGCKNKLDTDIGISITGIAGPGGGSMEKPVGTVWIGIATKSSVKAKRFLFSGVRDKVREQSCTEAIKLLMQII